MTIPEHRIAIAVAANVSGADSVSLLSPRISEVGLEAVFNGREAFRFPGICVIVKKW